MYLICEEPSPWPAIGCPIMTEILLVTSQGEGGGGDIYMRITRQSYEGPAYDSILWPDVIQQSPIFGK